MIRNILLSQTSAKNQEFYLSTTSEGPLKIPLVLVWGFGYKSIAVCRSWWLHEHNFEVRQWRDTTVRVAQQDPLAQFSHRVMQVKFITFEIVLLVVFLVFLYKIALGEIGIPQPSIKPSKRTNGEDARIVFVHAPRRDIRRHRVCRPGDRRSFVRGVAREITGLKAHSWTNDLCEASLCAMVQGKMSVEHTVG